MKKSSFEWYISESPRSKYITPFILFAIAFLFDRIIIKGIAAISNSVFEGFEVGIFANLLCILLVGLAIINIVKSTISRKFLTFFSVYCWMLILSTYWYIFRSNPYFTFYEVFNSYIYIVDCVLLFALSYFSAYIYIGKEWKNITASSLLEDNADIGDESNDKLSRSTYAKHVADFINTTISEKAIAISITSEWGFGKTTFLKFIEKQLDLKDSDGEKRNIVVHFNPWKFEKSEQMLLHFFDSLEGEFEKFDDQQVAAKIKDYSDKLTEVDDSAITKIIKESVTTIVGGDKTLSDRYESLNSAIERAGKRIIVIMDDLDRLSAEELISVLRLIRNTADFRNTFFIAAFDQNYVLNSLAEARNATNKENFLQKIFQLEVALPPIGKNVINELFKEYLEFDKFSIEERNRFEEILYKTNNPERLKILYNNFFNNNNDNSFYSSVIDIENFLRNVRDVKRFVNSFKLAYSTIASEVDLYDLLTIELVKYRFPSIYKLLAEQKLIDQDVLLNSSWKISDETFNKYLKNLNISQFDVDFIKDTLMELFNKDRMRSDRSIIKQANFHLYFQYQLFDSISVKEFNISRRKGRVGLEEYFSRVINENKYSQLLDYLDRIVAYDSTEEFENIIHCLFLTSNGIDSAATHSALLLAKKDFNIKTYYNNDVVMYNTYLEHLFRETQYNVNIRTEIAHQFIMYHLHKHEPQILTIELLQDILFDILYQAIQVGIETEETIYRLYTFGSDRIDNGRHIISDRANQLFRDYLNTNSMHFIKRVIYSPYIPNLDNLYSFNGYIPQIFGSYDLFEDFLFSLPESPCTNYVKIKFEEYKANGYRYITIEGFSNNPCIATT